MDNFSYYVSLSLSLRLFSIYFLTYKMGKKVLEPEKLGDGGRTIKKRNPNIKINLQLKEISLISNQSIYVHLFGRSFIRYIKVYPLALERNYFDRHILRAARSF